MNFKQNSLFKRNTELEEEQEVMQGGVLAVWGSPSSGKTTVSVKLADYLARKKKNVLLIFADMTAPPLPCICAAGDLEGEKSLGSILAATHVTENLIKKNCMFYRKNDYLSMIGMLKGENVFTYPPYDLALRSFTCISLGKRASKARSSSSCEMSSPIFSASSYKHKNFNDILILNGHIAQLVFWNDHEIPFHHYPFGLKSGLF